MEVVPSQLIKQITEWIRPIVSYEQSATNGYQIVCDSFYEYIEKIERVKTTRKTKGPWDDLLVHFRTGIAVCPMWVESDAVMDFFYDLNYHIGRVAELYSALPQKKMAK